MNRSKQRKQREENLRSLCLLLFDLMRDEL